jgi:osmotically-inducible protein OsmY
MHQGRWKDLLSLLFLLFLSCFSLLLTACVNIATTGAQAIYQHRNLQQNFNDSYLTLQIYQDIEADKKLDNTHISIATYHAKVLLAGQVPAPWQRARVEAIAENIEGVKRVYNLLTIAYPLSTLKKISDAWITAKLKTKFIASNDLDVTKIKIVTENGTVYLMGILPREEADAAIHIARETDGVEKVVKIFSYLQIVPSSG